MPLQGHVNDIVKDSFVSNGDGTNAQQVSMVSSGGFTASSTGTITRPSDTTAYAIGDLVANSTTAGSVTPFEMASTAKANPPGSFIIRRVRLRKSTSTLTNASFRVHLFAISPTVTVGDNAAFNVSGVLQTNGALPYLGYTDITLDTGFSDGAKGFSGTSFVDMQVKLASGTSIYALLEARAAYTPASAEQFMVTVEVLQD